MIFDLILLVLIARLFLERHFVGKILQNHKDQIDKGAERRHEMFVNLIERIDKGDEEIVNAVNAIAKHQGVEIIRERKPATEESKIVKGKT